MIATITGDPSSCSQLGGDLRTRAAALLAAHESLVAAAAVTARSATAVGDRVEADHRLLETVIDRLDVAGSALQRYAQELAEQAEELRRLATDVARAGLVLDGLRVVEPWGLATTDTATHRRAELPSLTARAERLASRVGRSRGALQRTLRESTGVLTRAADSTRTSLGHPSG